MTIDVARRVEQYVKLRDMIKAEEATHKEALKPKKDLLEQLNALLLGHLNQLNGDSVATGAGTVYRTEKKSASLADADAFMNYVQATGNFDLLDRKANVTAVEDHIKTHNAPPPGVNFTSAYVVGVRRA